ncbi:aminopeptidase [Hymenobacter sp. BRD128]|uniref:aminopeptidase n=1 Tax=Hymenobacter sp. BRD128 TaxID=2675878 RepID=UPI0015648D26|nr:aminopeptidase [Hymenobacter sp. BRD128]QKG55681.1 aminopeptidase [Hymenobacter sp. BRD128]
MTTICLLMSCGLGLLSLTKPAFGQNYEQIATQIVTTSAGVKPGDVVVITGGQYTLPLMEAVAVEVARAGGQANMLLTTDKAAHAELMDTPETAIQADKSNNWLLQSDVLITLPAYEDSRAVMAGVSPARQAKFAQVATASGINNKLDASKIRGVFVSYPSKSFAAAHQLDYPGYEQMMWSSIGADYTAIAGQAERLKQVLATGHKMHITSPAGTDLTLSLGGRPVFTDDGVVSAADQQSPRVYDRTAALPGGRVYGTCQETSATGRLAIANDYITDGKPLTGFKADLQGGQLTNVRADAGADAFQQQLAPYGPSAMQISNFSIGLNPLMKAQADKAFSPTTAAGMVYVRTGNNGLLGGQNTMPGGYGFPIANATVEVDGKVLLRNGQLVDPAAASAAAAPRKSRK